MKKITTLALLCAFAGAVAHAQTPPVKRIVLCDSVFAVASAKATASALARTAPERATAYGPSLREAAKRATQQTNEALAYEIKKIRYDEKLYDSRSCCCVCGVAVSRLRTAN